MNEKIKISKLKKMALDNLESTRPDDEIRKDNVGELLEMEINDKLRYKENINSQIVGQTASGKSTLATQIALDINKKLNRKMDITYICFDQIEYLRKMKDPNLKNICLQIDEWNAMGETGYNATTEQSLITYYSDIQAQRYIHRISCSPSTVMDNNADIILEVLATNKDQKTTSFLVYYRIVRPHEIILQLCGHATKNVAEALNCPFYQRYREKKFQKMDFLIRHGIKDVREIYYAKVILQVFMELQYTAKVINTNRDLISNFVEKIRRKEREFFSILTSEEIIRRSQGLLSIHRQMYLLSLRAKTMENRNERPELIKEMNENFERLKNTRDTIINDYNELIAIGEKYEQL